MGFLTEILSATVKVAITPVAVIKDVGHILSGEDPCATKTTLESAASDLGESLDELGRGNLL